MDDELMKQFDTNNGFGNENSNESYTYGVNPMLGIPKADGFSESTMQGAENTSMWEAQRGHYRNQGSQSSDYRSQHASVSYSKPESENYEETAALNTYEPNPYLGVSGKCKVVQEDNKTFANKNEMNEDAESEEKKDEIKYGGSQQKQELEPSENLSELYERLKSMEEKIDGLQADLRKVKDNMDSLHGYKEAVVQLKASLLRNQQNEERIYKELDLAKKDERYTIIKPFLEFMVIQHLDLMKSRSQYENDKNSIIDEYGDKAYQEIIELHSFQIDALERQLEVQGVTINNYVEGSDYDASEQMTSKQTIQTDNADLVGKVATVETQCYKYSDKILRKAKVRLYKLDK